MRAKGKDEDGEATLIVGRRLALHLMMQPDVSTKLLSDPRLKDQGFLSRILPASPQSTAGTRYQHPDNAEHAAYEEWARQSLAAYNHRVSAFLEHPATMAAGERNELAPRVLRLSADAARLCRQYADHIEGKLGPSGDYAPIVGFANKMPEHACRIAAVLTLFEGGPHALDISYNAFWSATLLVDFYASEALRLWDAAVKHPDIQAGEKLLAWFQKRPMEAVELQTVYQLGPAQVRTKADAERILKLLEDHNLVSRLAGIKAMWRLRAPIAA